MKPDELSVEQLDALGAVRLARECPGHVKLNGAVCRFDKWEGDIAEFLVTSENFADFILAINFDGPFWPDEFHLLQGFGVFRHVELEKFAVCDTCFSLGIIDADCVCAYDKYRHVTLEFEVCGCCGRLLEDGCPADTEFNQRQMEEHKKKHNLK